MLIHIIGAILFVIFINLGHVHPGTECTGCDNKGKCRAHNEEWIDGCNRKKCIVGEKKIRIVITQIGCDDDGKCRQPNETWRDRHDRCTTKTCVVNGCQGRIQDVSAGCNDALNNVCREPEEEWFVKWSWRKYICDLKICKVEGDAVQGLNPKTITKEKACQDDAGKCLAIGDTESMRVGNAYRTCTCKTKGIGIFLACET